MKTRILPFIAVLAVVACFGATTLEAAIIKGYLIVHNDTKVKVTVELDGATQGTVQPGRRGSWLIGDTKIRSSSYSIVAYGRGVAKSTIANGEYQDFEWRVKP